MTAIKLLFKNSRPLKYFIFRLTCVVFAVMLTSCEQNPTAPNEPPKPYGYQEDIYWPSLADSPWPMNHHDPQNTGRTKYFGPNLGEIEWQIEIGGVNSAIGFTALILGKDTTIYFGSSYEYDSLNQKQESYLYSVSKEGKIKWRYPLNYPFVSSSPLLTSNEIICIGSGDGNIYAIDKNGILKWKYQAGESIFLDAINVDRTGNIYFITNSHKMISLNSEGSLRWLLYSDGGFASSSEDGISFSPDGTVLYVPGNVFANSKSLYAISKEGEVLWTFGSEVHIMQPLIDTQGHIYFGYENSSDSAFYGFISLNPDGSRRWSYNSKVGNILPTIDKEGNLYFVGQCNVISLDYSGKFRWDFNSDILIPTSSLLSDNSGSIYYISADFVALDSNGKLKFVLEINDFNFSTAAIGFNTIYIGSVNNPKFLYSIK